MDKNFAATKVNLVKDIMSEICGSYKAYLNDLCKQMIKANAQRVHHPNAFLGFIYKYNQYMEQPRNFVSADLPQLDTSLIEEFENVLALQQSFEKDWRQVNQSLGTLLARGESMQDCYDLLPQEVHDILGGNLTTYFGGLTRTRPEAYAIQEIPFQLEAFRKLKLLIYQYIGNQLII